MLADIVVTFKDEWPLLVSIPLTGALVGWSTKLLALKMMFWPERFVGVGPIGWQGMVPRRTAKFAAIAADTVLGKLIDPRALLDRVDPQALVDTLAPQLIAMSDDIAREFLARYHPALWDALPERARQTVLGRVRARAPEIVARLLADVREDIDTAFDPRHAVVEHMVNNKHVMVNFTEQTAGPALRFMVRFGLLFGLGIGTVQMVIWAATHNHLILPLFGGFIGLFSDWIALQMIFAPRQPKRYLGMFGWHGLFFERREELSLAYARVAAESLLSPRVLMRAMLEGPGGERLFARLAREAEAALHAEERVAGPVLDLAVGSDRYRQLRAAILERAPELVERLQPELEEYTRSVFDVEKLIGETMLTMDDGEYENILRPMFKDDEWLIVAVGGTLGFLVGELQLTLLTRL